VSLVNTAMIFRKKDEAFIPNTPRNISLAACILSGLREKGRSAGEIELVALRSSPFPAEYHRRAFQ